MKLYLYIFPVYISVHEIHFGSSKYFTTNGSVSTPIAFLMDKSLDISVFSFRLFSAVQFFIWLKRAFKININQILPIFRFRNFQSRPKFSKLQTSFIDKVQEGSGRLTGIPKPPSFLLEQNENYEKIMQYDEDNIFCYNRYFKIRLSSKKVQNSLFKPKWSFLRKNPKNGHFQNFSRK